MIINTSKQVQRLILLCNAIKIINGILNRPKLVLNQQQVLADAGLFQTHRFMPTQ